MSLNFQASRFACSWPWDILVMLCDGRIVCGCGDPTAKRVLGDTRTESVHAIWTGPLLEGVRRDLNGGGSTFCGDCPLKLPLPDGQAPPQRGLDVPAHPSRLFIEATVACNISCLQACCGPESGIIRTRQAGMLDFELFRRVIDETGASLGRIDFLLYGETFLHKRAVEMCEYIKTKFPHIYLYTSTNGLAFTDATARRLVHSGIDEVTFSIDGASQETYERYRRRGHFDTAMANMRAMTDEKHKAGRDLPFINWRYILFTWNDSDPEMALARRLAEECGVDRLSWEITDHPEEAFSRRFAPGTPDHAAIRQEIWDTNYLGNAIPGATPIAHIEVPRPVPHLPVVGRAGGTVRVRTRVSNLSKRPFPANATYGRRFVQMGAQLCAPDGTLIDLNHARAPLPHHLQPGDCVEIRLDAPVPARGRYTLKFDLVCEGVDWFEHHGSPTTTVAFWAI
jgi:hypothetical protein